MWGELKLTFSSDWVPQQHMEAAEQEHHHQQQLLFDVETASSGDGNKDHVRQLGMSKLHAVLSKAEAGQDPWEYQQQPKRGRPGDLAGDLLSLRPTLSCGANQQQRFHHTLDLLAQGL